MTLTGIDKTTRARLVEDMLTYMTLEEKLGQLRVVRLTADRRRPDGGFSAELSELLESGQVAAISGVETREEALELQTIAVERSRFGIPLLFTSKGDPAAQSLWPSPLAMAASWDSEAVEQVSAAIATDAIAKGWNLVATPPVDLLTGASAEPQESFGTSVHLAKRIACGLIQGLQGDSPSSLENVLGLLCYGPLASPGPERTATEQLIRSILRASDLAAIEEMPSREPEGEGQPESEVGTVSDIHSAFTGIDLGAWRRLARLSKVQSFETDRRRIANGMDDGYLSLNMVDEAVRRVLAAKSDLGLFRNPYYKLGPAAEPSSQAALARRAAMDDLARKSIVLLRNDGDILPLAPDTDKVLVMGSRPETTAGLRQALREAGIEHGSVSGLALRTEDSSTDGHARIAADGLAIGMACDAASRTDIVLLAVTDADCEPIAGRPQLRLGAAVEAMVRAVLNANQRFALLELTRLPVDLGDLAPRIPVQLLAWTGFENCEGALCEVLTGRFNPSGRLPLPLPADDQTASLPFGHGLGYSRVSYKDMTVEFGSDRLIARTTLHNTGEHDAIETVLLYLRSPAWAAGAQAQLRCFQRVALAAGESQRVQFELALEELGEIGPDGRIIVEPGVYEILLGKDAAHLAGREIDLPGSMIRAIEGFSRSVRLRSFGF